jgi:hypothetical protein
MTFIPLTSSLRALSTGLAAALTVALTVALSGCGGGSSPAQGSVVTVTITPTVTAKAAPRPAPTPTSTPTGVARSDVVGRGFDLGAIVRVEDDAGVPVLIFDRWTARGVADSTLAARGVPIAVHTDAPYENLNTKTTYHIPVAPGAAFTYNHCVAMDQPARRSPSTVRAFAALKGSEKVILLTLDPKGRVLSAQNDPAC